MPKGLFAFILGLLLINNTFAMEIHQGTLIDHQEWTSENNIVIKVEDHVKKNSTSLRKSIHSQIKSKKSDEGKDGILLTNKLQEEMSGVLGNKTIIDGRIEVYIENFTTSRQAYEVYSHFCLSNIKTAKINSCAHSSYTIELDPEGYFQLNLIRSFSPDFEAAGDYQALLTTFAERNNSSSYFATYSKGSIAIQK